MSGAGRGPPERPCLRGSRGEFLAFAFTFAVVFAVRSVAAGTAPIRELVLLQGVELGRSGLNPEVLRDDTPSLPAMGLVFGDHSI